MGQFNLQKSNRRKIEWEGRDIISVLKEMHIPYDMDNAVLVDVESMPPEIRELAEKMVLPKACFYNEAMMLSVMHRSDMKYVIGYASAPVPFEHAWIRVGGSYLDPTWEMFGKQFGSEYLSLCEMGCKELDETMAAMKTDEPPDLMALHRFRRHNS
ncbi:MAG: hypothetical protein OET90_07800 [Desulfuromonadales bacterium]|nr:hypothetical protein [Desulfuromonadales bacterium]